MPDLRVENNRTPVPETKDKPSADTDLASSVGKSSKLIDPREQSIRNQLRAMLPSEEKNISENIAAVIFLPVTATLGVFGLGLKGITLGFNSIEYAATKLDKSLTERPVDGSSKPDEKIKKD